jgi:murein DD-endopeptidase MepM/ murein hydrolase activator NlpD
MSDVNVAEGQQIRQGDPLGSVGAKGRATGPHLCWRLHWNGRGVSMDPQSLVGPDEN